ncbi:MAG: hemolysin family protein, partial [Actinomycetota bacterium]
PQIALVVVLVAINAALSGAELALVSLREGQLQRLEERSASGAMLARLARQPNQFLATIQIGITLAGFLASAAAAVSLAEPLEPAFSFLGGAAEPVAVIVVTLVLSYFTLVFGELAPKRIALQRAEGWGLAMARPLSLLTTATKPLVWLLSKSSDVVVRLAGGDPDQQRAEVTEAELRELVTTQASFEPEHREILHGAFDIAERSLDEILVPRVALVTVDESDTCAEAQARLIDTGHSRAPVTRNNNVDDIVGVVHLRQLLADAAAPVSSVATDLVVFPEAARVLTTLREMQTMRAQMALVVNEHGGVEGIVTVEDLIEELVGEIYDEHDQVDLIPVVEADGTLVVPGRFPIHEMADHDTPLPTGEYATVAGLVLDRIGRLPEQGTKVPVEQWTLEVRAIRHHTIVSVAITERDDAESTAP